MQEPRKNKIHYTPKSHRDLDDIWDYITSELQNRSAAENTVNRIMDDVDRLEHYPLLGTPLSAVTAADDGYRFIISGNYMVFYRVNGNDIYIDRILYGRRNYLRVLFEDVKPGNTE